MAHDVPVPAVRRSALHLPVVSPRARRFSLVIRVLTTSFVGLGVLLSVAIFILSATGTARLVPVLSNSMAPDMPVGSLALTVQVAKNSVQVGDVVVFSNPTQPSTRVIHRITHVYGSDEADKFSNWSPDVLFATTQGDNNPQADPWIVSIADATVWRLQTSVPLLGYPAIWLGHPLTPVWLLAAVVFVVVLVVVRSFWRRPRAHVRVA